MVQKAIDGELDEPIATVHSGEPLQTAEDAKNEKLPKRKTPNQAQKSIREISDNKATRAPSVAIKIKPASNMAVVKGSTKKSLSPPVKPEIKSKK